VVLRRRRLGRLAGGFQVRGARGILASRGAEGFATSGPSSGRLGDPPPSDCQRSPREVHLGLRLLGWAVAPEIVRALPGLSLPGGACCRGSRRCAARFVGSTTRFVCLRWTGRGSSVGPVGPPPMGREGPCVPSMRNEGGNRLRAPFGPA
jgi:hypothetical protein